MNDTERPNDRAPLNEALRKFWPYWVGLVIYPFIVFSFEGIPSKYMQILFFAVFLLANFPVFTKKAPREFGFVLIGIWMISIMLALNLGFLFEFITGSLE